MGAWLVWVADQSEAGFDEAQLATYGIRPFGSTGSCENIAVHTHSGKGWGVAWLGRQGEDSVVSRVLHVRSALWRVTRL